MEKFKFKKIIILSPHTDDGELGCGASISKFAERGSEIFEAIFSVAVFAGEKENTKEETAEEAIKAASIIGIKDKNIRQFDYRVRYFGEMRQQILDDMIKLKNEIEPDAVFLPALSDFHQDHEVISREGVRAFKHSIILGYEEPWNQLKSGVNFFVRINESQLKKKILAVDQYASQNKRKFIDGEKIKSLAAVRGLQAGTDFAEAFEGIRFFC